MANFFGNFSGKGSSAVKSKERSVNRVIEVAVGDIVPNPHQPRRYFSQDELVQLANSIKQDGILQPLTVRRVDEHYELVSGERRLRAGKMAGLERVPCIVIEITERNSALLALIENIQREDLTFFEEANAISKLISFYGMTQEDAAIRLGLAQSTVANKLRLLKLSDEEKDVIVKLGLTERHARALLKLADKEQRMAVIERIQRYNLNVEKTEEFIEALKNGEKMRESYRKRAVILRDVRLFVNTINKAVQTMQLAGVNANAQKVEREDCIEYLITIPVDKSGEKPRNLHSR